MPEFDQLMTLINFGTVTANINKVYSRRRRTNLREPHSNRTPLPDMAMIHDPMTEHVLAGDVVASALSPVMAQDLVAGVVVALASSLIMV